MLLLIYSINKTKSVTNKTFHVSESSTTATKAAQEILIIIHALKSESIIALFQQTELEKLHRIVAKHQQWTCSLLTTDFTLSALLIIDRNRNTSSSQYGIFSSSSSQWYRKSLTARSSILNDVILDEAQGQNEKSLKSRWTKDSVECHKLVVLTFESGMEEAQKEVQEEVQEDV